MRKTFSLLALLSISACATGPGLQSRMAAYTGASAQTRVQNLGVPDKQVTVNGTQYFAYDERHTEISPGYVGFAGVYGGPFYGGGFYGDPFLAADIPPVIIDNSCETTFTLQHDKVVTFTLRGNDCS